jgi:hypothetical protein
MSCSVLSTVIDDVRFLSTTLAVEYVTQTLGMPASQAAFAMAFMRAAELVTRWRIVTGSSPVAHCGQFGGAEQLKLTHNPIVSYHAKDRLTPSAEYYAKFGGSAEPNRDDESLDNGNLGNGYIPLLDSFATVLQRPESAPNPVAPSGLSPAPAIEVSGRQRHDAMVCTPRPRDGCFRVCQALQRGSCRST